MKSVLCRACAAAAAFREAARRPSVDLADEFAEYVARCLDCPVRDVIGPDLATRLERAGVPRVLALRSSELFDAMIASRHGGGATDEDVRSACAIVGALERELDQA